jgi:HK97 family phage major capsid protein
MLISFRVPRAPDPRKDRAMNAHIRTRGIVAVRATPTAENILTNLTADFGNFKDRYDRRQTEIENSIDEVVRALAAIRIGGGGDAAPTETSKALNAFGEFVKTGKPDAMHALMPRADMTSDSDPNGGYTVPREVGSTIIRRQLEFSPMRRLASVVQTRSDIFEQLMQATGGTAAWAGEREARPKTDGATLRALQFPAHEIYANPSVSQKLLDDSAFDIANFVTATIAEDLDLKEGAAFISGDGVNKPRGFLSYGTPVTTVDATRAFHVLQYVPSGVAAALSDATHNGGDALIDMVYSLRAGYRRNARWLMNSKTAGVVRRLKTSDDLKQYLWVNSIAPGQLLGYPVEFDENMPDINVDTFPIAFGDFQRGYLINDRIGVRILRDPFTNKPFVMFYTTKRVGGGLLDSNAIKLLKIASS